MQRKVIKTIPRLQNKPYKERLNGYVTTDHTITTRNNGFKIIGKRFRSNEAKHFFFNRIVSIWNSLPAQIVNSKSIESFKKNLDKNLTSVP